MTYREFWCNKKGIWFMFCSVSSSKQRSGLRKVRKTKLSAEIANGRLVTGAREFVEMGGVSWWFSVARWITIPWKSSKFVQSKCSACLLVVGRLLLSLFYEKDGHVHWVHCFLLIDKMLWHGFLKEALGNTIKNSVCLQTFEQIQNSHSKIPEESLHDCSLETSRIHWWLSLLYLLAAILTQLAYLTCEIIHLWDIPNNRALLVGH